MKARFLPLIILAAGSSLRAQLPTGANVAAGNVALTQAAGAMTLTQTSRNAIVNWQSFDVGAANRLRVVQPDAAAAMLARVTGGTASSLQGALQADGKLFLINSKGIVVGRDAVIDTAGFVASTLDVSDDEFRRGGALTFRGDSAAGVVNLGSITAREGNVFLFAHTVRNAGTINATRGTAGLGAGTEVYLAARDASDFTIKLNLAATAARTGVDNAGIVVAAQAQLEAAGGSIYGLAVNQSGIVRATGVENKNGRVLLTAAGGTVGVSGEIAARNADGSGGEILVGGEAHGANAAIANAARTVVTAGAQLDASAATDTAPAGRVIVWADDATRFLGTLRATGVGGGFAEVSGKRFLDFNPAAAVQLGKGGTLLLDPDALVISADPDAGTGASGTNPFTFTAVSEPATLNVTTLQNQLATSNVMLDTSASAGDITFNSAVLWSTNNSLTVRSGNGINLNADITGGTASALALYTGWRATAPPESGLPDIRGQLFLDSTATLTVGALTYGANALSSAPGGYVVGTPHTGGSAFFDGSLHVGTLGVDLSGGGTGVLASGADNAIGAFRTSGTGTLNSAYVVNRHGSLDVTINSATAGGPYLQFITPGTLTLKSGSSLDFTDPGTVLLASTGGAFVNEAGASVFGANARYLIYTSTPAATARGGLTPTYVFNTGFDINTAPAPYDGDAVSRIIYSGAQPVLTLTADDKTRTYGDANPAFSITGSGFVDGDTLGTAMAGAAAFATAATRSSSVGRYTITPSAGTLASSLYSLAFAGGSLTVNQAALTVTVSSTIAKSEGDPNPNFANFTNAAGLRLADTLETAVPDLAFTTAATTLSPAGTYAVTATGTSTNYALTFQTGQLTIASVARPILTYAADSLSRIYGDANPSLTFSRSGVMPGVADDVTGTPALSTVASQTSGVGGYTINLGQGSLASANYQFAFTPGTLTVTKAPLTAAINNASRAPHAADPAFSATYTGFKNSDTSAVISGLAFTTTATASSPSGSYPIGGSGTAANYDLTFVPGALTIGGILNYTALNASRTYGSANPAFSYSVNGLLSGDTLASVVTGAPSLSTAATQSSGVGAYVVDIGRGTLSSPSYGFTFIPGTLTINRAPLTISANDASRTYGAANPTFGATYNGLVNGDTAAVVSGLTFGTSATTTSNVGRYTVTPGGATAANYRLSFEPGTLSITPALLSITVDSLSRVYGDANPALTGSISGLVNGETAATAGVNFATTATAASAVSHVGYPITASLNGSNANYALSFVTSGTLDVTPAPLIIAIGNATRVYGDADPAFNYTVSGLKNDDSASLVTVSNLSSLAPATAGIGSYGIIGFPWISSPNYTVPSQVAGTLTITPRPLTITANNQTRVYGEANPAFAATFTGLASFDTPASIGTLNFATQATQTSGVGNWGITFTPVSSQNYTITRAFGTLTITPAPLTFGALLEVSRLYGRADPTLTLPTVSGLKNNDTLSGLGFTFTGVPAANADTGAYTYSITATNPNYTFTAPTAAFRIDPAPLAVAVTPTGRLYGDANPASYEFSANGLAFGQTAASVLSIRNATEAGTDVGIYSLTPILNSRNYTISAVTGAAFQINPRILTLDLPYYARYYGDVTPTFNLADVIVGGDRLAGFDTLASLIAGLHTAIATDERTNTGYYRIDPTFAVNPNYRYSWTPGYLAVVPRPVEVTVNDAVAFGGNNLPAGFSAAALGVNLVLLDLDHPSNPGTGYSASISNLPWFDLGLGTSNAALYFTTSATNDTQRVGVATALGDVYFPARPNRTAPQAASDPLPTDLPYTTVNFTTLNPTTSTVDSPLAALTSGIIYNNGHFIVDPTGTKKDTRFADVIHYIVPHLSLGGNYVVTKVSNGKLTLKADPVKMEQTLAAEALVAKRKAAEAAFLNGPARTGVVNSPGTFGLTKDEYPLIREAFVNMLYDMVLKGGEDPFLLALTGLSSVKDLNMVTNDQIIFWLADIHTNVAKQAILLPAMVSYGVKIAGLAPARRSAAQNALVGKMAPFLADARSDFIDKAQSAQNAWGDLQATSGNLQTLTGTEVPYEQFVQTAVAQTVSGSFAALSKKTDGLSETDLVNMAGLGGGVAGGVGTGMSFASLAAENIASIYPEFGQTLANAAARAGKLAYEAAGGTGKEILGFGGLEEATEQAARQAGKVAQETYEVLGDASKASSTATGVFAIISVAVTVLIDKTVNVAEEQQQKAKFDTLVASRNAPVDVNAMTDDTQGRAIMTVGLFKMFGGGT